MAHPPTSTTATTSSASPPKSCARSSSITPAKRKPTNEAATSTRIPSRLDLLALDDALLQLAQADPRKAELVELRFFAGLTNEQTASVTGLSLSTIEREWRFARAWLLERLGNPQSNPQSNPEA